MHNDSCSTLHQGECDCLPGLYRWMTLQIVRIEQRGTAHASGHKLAKHIDSDSWQETLLKIAKGRVAR